MNDTALSTDDGSGEQGLPPISKHYHEYTLQDVWAVMRSGRRLHWEEGDLLPSECDDFYTMAHVRQWRKNVTELLGSTLITAPASPYRDAAAETIACIKEIRLLETKAKLELQLRTEEQEAKGGSGQQEQQLQSGVARNMPLEMVVHISLFLQGAEVARGMALVCAEWRELLEADSSWRTRFLTEFGQHDADRLPAAYGWKQKFVMTDAFMRMRCSFCFTSLLTLYERMVLARKRVQRFLKYRPIFSVRVFACDGCKKEHITSKTALKRKYCLKDEEMEGMTPYHPRMDSTVVVYFTTEFMARMDNQDQDFVGTIQGRIEERDSKAKKSLERLVATSRKNVQLLQKALEKDTLLSAEEAKKVARRGGEWREFVVRVMRDVKEAERVFKHIAGRPPTYEEQEQLQNVSQDRFGVPSNVSQKVEEFWAAIKRREQYVKMANTIISRKFRRRYKRWEDLPSYCREKVKGLFGPKPSISRYSLLTYRHMDNVTTAYELRAVLQGAEFKGMLEREEKLRYIIETAGFHYEALVQLVKFKTVIDTYIDGRQSMSAAEMAKHILSVYASMSPWTLGDAMLEMPKSDRRRMLRHVAHLLLDDGGDSADRNMVKMRCGNTAVIVGENHIYPVSHILDGFDGFDGFRDYSTSLYYLQDGDAFPSAEDNGHHLTGHGRDVAASKLLSRMLLPRYAGFSLSPGTKEFNNLLYEVINEECLICGEEEGGKAVGREADEPKKKAMWKKGKRKAQDKLESSGGTAQSKVGGGSSRSGGSGSGSSGSSRSGGGDGDGRRISSRRRKRLSNNATGVGSGSGRRRKRSRT